MLGHDRLNIFPCSLAQRASLGPLLHHKGRKGHKEPEALLVDTIPAPLKSPALRPLCPLWSVQLFRRLFDLFAFLARCSLPQVAGPMKHMYIVARIYL
jgi:hypothetical protein